MKVSCTRKDLLEGVQTAGRAVSTRTSLPILGHLLIRGENDRLRIAATDLEIGMECLVQATVEEEGSFTVPAKTLQEIISTLPEAEVTITVDESHTVNIRCGASECSVLGLSPEEFPMLPEVRDENGFTIDRSVLRDAIKKTIFAVSPDDTRAVYTGIYLASSENGLRVVSMARHRLCLQECPVTQMQGEIEVIVPGRAMNELQRIIPDEDGAVTADISDTQIAFRVGDIVLVSRLIEGEFPSYERVIPDTCSKRLIIPTQPFLHSVKMASIFARENANRVIIRTVNGQMVVAAESITLGKVEENVEAVCDAGEDVEMAFNCRYLMDVLSIIDDEAVAFEITDSMVNVVIRPESQSDYVYVVAPMYMP